MESPPGTKKPASSHSLGSSSIASPAGSAIDLATAAVAIVLYAVWSYAFQYKGMFGETDLYRVAIGLLHGARTGTDIAPALHYGKAFSFGYIAALYWFLDRATLAEPQTLLALINSIGYWSALAGCVLFWLMTRILYGLRTATIALCLFAFSPLLLDLGTSGSQILPAFALLMAGALSLCVRSRGAMRALLACLGAVLLLAALTVRAEVGLAFPFIATMRADTRSFRSYAAGAACGAVAPAMACLAFGAIKHTFIDSQSGVDSLNSLLNIYVLIHQNIPAVILVFPYACGVATTLVAIAAIVWIVRHPAFVCPTPSPARAEWIQVLPALILILPSFAFWMMNPRPGRHFILCLAGLSILVGLACEAYCAFPPLGKYAALAAVLLLNQGIAAATESFMLRAIPSKLITPPGHVRLFPGGIYLGTAIAFHRETIREFSRAQEFAAQLRGSCDPKLAVITELRPQVFWSLYNPSASWSNGRIGAFLYYRSDAPGRSYLVLSGREGWPNDPVESVLNDPTLRDFKILRDPETRSIYDRAAIPASRAARLGCTADVQH